MLGSGLVPFFSPAPFCPQVQIFFSITALSVRLALFSLKMHIQKVYNFKNVSCILSIKTPVTRLPEHFHVYGRTFISIPCTYNV